MYRSGRYACPTSTVLDLGPCEPFITWVYDCLLGGKGNVASDREMAVPGEAHALPGRP